ncbi:hypothetical protein RV10_GL004709 [Enterococcus pallens]|nr:hypothetical protein RV10_GL004709 [Enterococcus pallens]
MLKNSWWTAGIQEWEASYGEVELTEDGSGFMNLSMDSSTSCQVNQRVALKPKHRYFVMFDVKVTRYVKGLFGVHFNGKFEAGSPSMGLRRLSNGYETITGVLKTPEAWRPQLVFAGSIHRADGAGTIRRLSLFDLTELYGEGNEPEADEFYQLLPNRQDESGLHLSVRESFSTLSCQLYKHHFQSPVTDEEASAIFLAEMRKKTQLLGMDNTTLKNINGFYAKGQLTTSRDLIKLGLHATGYGNLLSIWGKQEHTAAIYGRNVRKVSLKSAMTDEAETSYTILGGKFDGVGNKTLNSLALLADKEGELYLASVMGASSEKGLADRHEAIKELIDAAKKKKKTAALQSPEGFKAKSGSILLMPKGNPHYYTCSPPKCTYSVHETEPIPPASLTKLINALVVLDHVQNLYETFEVTSFDLLGESGPKLGEGDILSHLDALHFLLLSSSNTAAKAFSRVVGHKIVQSRGRITL